MNKEYEEKVGESKSEVSMTLLEQYEKVMTEKLDDLSDRIANDMNGETERR